MELDKLQALCETIKKIFDQDKTNIEIFFKDQLPKGYLKRIQQELPDRFAWPTSHQSLSRLMNKNKESIESFFKSKDINTNINKIETLFDYTEQSERSESYHTEHSDYSESNIHDTETEASTYDDNKGIIEPSESVKSDYSEPTEQSEHSEFVTRSELKAIFSDMLKQALSERQAIVPNNLNDIELPPPREKIKGGKGRSKEKRSWVKLSTSIDSTLFDLFEAETKEKRLSKSELLDAILWTRYGKPVLD